MASAGKLPGGAPLHFEDSQDVSGGGVLAALPALMACGLLRHSGRYFQLLEGYYTLSNIFILLGFMALRRINTIEQLRRCPPGEWGKVLGLDRCPGVETLRKKIQLITASNDKVENWSAELAKDWSVDEFIPTQVRLKNGQIVTWKLAERGMLLGSKKGECSWVREVRKLSERGHQTSVLSTNFKLETSVVASE